MKKQVSKSLVSRYKVEAEALRYASQGIFLDNRPQKP